MIYLMYGNTSSPALSLLRDILQEIILWVMFITNRKTNTRASLRSLKNKIEPLDFLFTKPQIQNLKFATLMAGTNMKYKCFCLSLDFLNIMLENRLRFLSIFFLTFVSLFSWTVYFVRFNTGDKQQPT